MAGNNLSTKVTADVVDLQTKFAIAKAETNALASEMNKLARQSAAGIIDPAGQARLQQVAEDMLHAKSAASDLAEQMKRAGDSGQGLAGAMESVRSPLQAIGGMWETLGLAAAYEGFRKLIEVVVEFGERAKQISTVSDVLGVTAEQMQALQAAGEEAGVGEQTLTRSSEQLVIMLQKARDGSSSAIDKLRALGVSTEQINDPTFRLNDLLQTLHDRLTDSTTAQSTQNALMADFGARTALVVEALKKYDGSAAGVAAVMDRLNGLSGEQNKELAELDTQWKEFKTSIENTSEKATLGVVNWIETKSVLAQVANVTGTLVQKYLQLRELVSGIKLNPVAMEAVPDTGADQEAAGSEQRLQAQQQFFAAWNVVSQQQLAIDVANTKAAVQEFKSGTEERLRAVQAYAAAIAQYEGPNSEKAREANAQALAAQREYSEEVQRLTEQQVQAKLRADERVGQDVLRVTQLEIEEDGRVLQEMQKNMQARTAAEAKVYEDKQADTRRMIELDGQVLQHMQEDAKQYEKAWKPVIDSVSSSFASNVTRMLERTETLTQAARSMFASFFDAIIKKMAEWAAQWIAQHLLALAASKTTAMAEVVTNAGVAGSGAMASVAAIPYVGWAMAPEIGAATYAEAMALGSAAGGMWEVPSDQVMQVHRKESILPPGISERMRDFFEGANKGGGGGETHNYHGDMHLSGSNDLLRQIANPRNARGAMQAVAGAYRRGAR